MNGSDEVNPAIRDDSPNERGGREGTAHDQLPDGGGLGDTGGPFGPETGEEAAGQMAEGTAEESQQAAGGSDQVRVVSTVKEAHESHVETVGIKCEHNYNILKGSGDEGLLWRRDLAREDFEVYSRDQFLDIDAAFLISSESLNPIVQCLESHRVVLVAGERDLGKGALSQVAASRIARRDPAVREVLVATSLDLGLRVKPERLFKEGTEFTHRIVLLEDAFERGNEDLSRLAQRMDEPRLEALTRHLAAAKAYLLLTSDLGQFPGKVERLQGLGILVQVSPPSTEILLQILRQRMMLRHVGEGRKEPGLHETMENILQSRGEWLATRLRTVPKVVEFVDQYLESVLRGEMSLEDAVDRQDDLDSWLFTELPEDRPAWAFVLALVLASTDPRSSWVSWLPLHRLWREVERVLDKELGGVERSSPRPLSRLVADQRFVTQTRSDVRSRPYPMGAAARFREPEMADRLWRVLLGSGRSLLATLQPRLRKLAESLDPSVSDLAARALGRMGELDPRGVVLNPMDAWLNMGGEDRPFEGAFLFGEMLVGVSLGEGRSYFMGLLERLQGATGDRSLEKAEAAVVAFVSLGVAMPEEVLKRLWIVLRRQVPKAPTAAPPLWRRVEERLDALAQSKQPARREGPVVLQPGEAERATLGILGHRAGRILEALQFALVGLCFGGDPIQVLQAMAQWMDSGKEKEVAPWVAFLTLRGRGMLRVLEDFPLRLPSDHQGVSISGDRHPCSRILLAAEEEEEIGVIAEFLTAAFGACGAFPLAMRLWLRGNWAKVLEGWLKQGSRSDLAGPRVVAFLSRLLDAEDETLRKEVFNLLQVKATGEKGELQDLAREILRAGMPRGAGTEIIRSSS